MYVCVCDSIKLLSFLFFSSRVDFFSPFSSTSLAIALNSHDISIDTPLKLWLCVCMWGTKATEACKLSTSTTNIFHKIKKMNSWMIFGMFNGRKFCIVWTFCLWLHNSNRISCVTFSIRSSCSCSIVIVLNVLHNWCLHEQCHFFLFCYCCCYCRCFIQNLYICSGKIPAINWTKFKIC